MRMNVSFQSAAYLIRWCARLEFALHEVADYLIGDAGGVPGVDWGRFQARVRADVARMASSEVTRDLLGDDFGSPPRKMVVENGHVVFRRAPIEGPIGDRLIVASRRVRNNLVHGGKETADQERYPGHDELLVKAAANILTIAAGVDARVANLCYDGMVAD
jgi:hypothetical protein